MNIAITGTTESQSLQLLVKVVDSLQNEKDEQLKYINSLSDRIQKIEGEKEEVKGLYNKLKIDYETLEDKKIESDKSYTDLKSQYDTLVEQKGESDKSYTDLMSQYDTLVGQKGKLEKSYTDLKSQYDTLFEQKAESDKSYTELRNQYDILVEQKGKSDNSYTELKAEYDDLDKRLNEEKTEKITHSIKLLSSILEATLVCDLNKEWTDYIESIRIDINNFITDKLSIDDIKLKIVSKNGWLAKLASIQWWSKADSVQAYLPKSFGRNSCFNILFNNLLSILEEFEICVSIPQCDFSGSIENYKVDYDGNQIISKLFPNYQPDKFVLCEINYVSYNNNIGKCIGYGNN